MRSALAVAALALAACGPTKPAVSRVATSTTTDLSGKWNDTDARLTSETMIKDCFARPWLKKFADAKSRAPKMRVRTIKDHTGEHIDAQVFVKNLERAMVNSGDVDVVAQTGAEMDSVHSEQDYGASGRVSDDSAASVGQMEGADYVLVGRVACIVDDGGGEATKFYKVTLELVDASGGKKVWMGDHEIKKVVRGRDPGTCTGDEPPAPEARVAKTAPAGERPVSGGTAQQMVDVGGGRQVAFAVVRGTPDATGCADGEREAFADLARWPSIAGCLASWGDRRSMRTRGTGAVCGDDAGACGEPADACAPGWHVCGADGNVNDLLGRVSAEECRGAAAGGTFSGGLSHCAAQSGCQYGDATAARRNYPCFKNGWCSEAVCCGKGCGKGACPDGVWPGATPIAQGTDQGCAAITSKRAGGVLCCKGAGGGKCGTPGERCL